MSEDLQYPIGDLSFIDSTPDLRREWIKQFRDAPILLRKAVGGLNDEQLQSTYRPGGWTLAQVVHHLAEMDTNSNTRLKFAMTESIPTVAAAQQALWAEVPDAKSTKIKSSLSLFEAIRLRWADAWESLRGSNIMNSKLIMQTNRS